MNLKPAIALLLIDFSLLSPVLNGQEVSGQQARSVDDAVANYSKTRLFAPRYSVAMRCRLTSIDHGDGRKSGSTINWYLFSRDYVEKVVRYDSSTPLLSTATFDEHNFHQTLIRTENGIRTRNGTGFSKNLSYDDIEDKDLKLNMPILRLDPFNLPFVNIVDMSANLSVRRQSTVIEEKFTPSKLLSVEGNSRFLEADYRINDKLGLHRTIKFDRSIDDLPYASTFIRELDGKSLRLARVRVAWGEFPDKVRLPVRVHVNGAVGNPEKPMRTLDYEFDLDWVWEILKKPEIWEAVFDADKAVESVELRGMIVDNAMKFKPIGLSWKGKEGK